MDKLTCVAEKKINKRIEINFFHRESKNTTKEMSILTM